MRPLLTFALSPHSVNRTIEKNPILLLSCSQQAVDLPIFIRLNFLQKQRSSNMLVKSVQTRKSIQKQQDINGDIFIFAQSLSITFELYVYKL